MNRFSLFLCVLVCVCTYFSLHSQCVLSNFLFPAHPSVLRSGKTKPHTPAAKSPSPFFSRFLFLLFLRTIFRPPSRFVTNAIGWRFAALYCPAGNDDLLLLLRKPSRWKRSRFGYKTSNTERCVFRIYGFSFPPFPSPTGRPTDQLARQWDGAFCNAQLTSTVWDGEKSR